MTKIRKEKAELSSAAKNKKLSTPPPHHQLSFPCIRGSIHPHVPEAAFGNVLTATDNDESETNSNTNNEVRKMSHDARYTMGPRVREDDKNKRRKSRAKFNGKEQKTQHTAATPPTVIPAHAGIHTPTHARSRVGNVLTATDNDKSETNHNTDNEVPKPSHSARYPMGPRVREDDKNKKRKSRAKFSGKEQKNSAHRRHTPNRHSRAYGEPFIHTCQKPRLEMYSPQQTTTKAKPTATPTMKC